MKYKAATFCMNDWKINIELQHLSYEILSCYNLKVLFESQECKFSNVQKVLQNCGDQGWKKDYHHECLYFVQASLCKKNTNISLRF